MASIKDEATFKAEMPKVLQNCGTCHNDFPQEADRSDDLRTGGRRAARFIWRTGDA